MLTIIKLIAFTLVWKASRLYRTFDHSFNSAVYSDSAACAAWARVTPRWRMCTCMFDQSSPRIFPRICDINIKTVWQYSHNIYFQLEHPRMASQGPLTITDRDQLDEGGGETGSTESAGRERQECGSLGSGCQVQRLVDQNVSTKFNSQRISPPQ